MELADLLQKLEKERITTGLDKDMPYISLFLWKYKICGKALRIPGGYLFTADGYRFTVIQTESGGLENIYYFRDNYKGYRISTIKQLLSEFINFTAKNPELN